MLIPPSLPHRDFPDAEHDSIFSISKSLSSLCNYVDDFAAALALFDQCSQEAWRKTPITAKWSWVAARDGGMTVFHIGEALDGIRSSFKDCPQFRAVTEHTRLRAAAKLLDERFPVYRQIRHAIGHRAELTATKEDFVKNALSEDLDVPGLGYIAKGNIMKALNGRTYIDTFEGESISYNISQESLNSLIGVAETAFSAFPALKNPAHL